MPYPNQYQGSGFGGNSFANAANPSPAAYPMGNMTAASRTYAPQPAPAAPSSSPGGINVNAGSRSVNPFGSVGIPDLSFADPNILQRLDISNLIYDTSRGGYITQGQLNSHLASGALQGGDPGANRMATEFYNYIGSLPTQQRGTPALNQLNAASGIRGSGPSLNSVYAGLFNNASPFERDRLRSAGFQPSYRGPYGFGGRDGY